MGFITFAFNDVICDKFADPGTFEWSALMTSQNLLVYNGFVVDMAFYLQDENNSQEMKDVANNFVGTDATRGISMHSDLKSYVKAEIARTPSGEIVQIEGDSV